MRQPLEEGRVTISRALASSTFPASFILVAAMNPCPCGYLGDARRPCKCNPMQIERYIGRISGPLLDRIDIHIEVPSVPFQELSASADGTSSALMREQVNRARDAQMQRFGADSLRYFCLTHEAVHYVMNEDQYTSNSSFEMKRIGGPDWKIAPESQQASSG